MTNKMKLICKNMYDISVHDLSGRMLDTIPIDNINYISYIGDKLITLSVAQIKIKGTIIDSCEYQSTFRIWEEKQSQSQEQEKDNWVCIKTVQLNKSHITEFQVINEKEILTIQLDDKDTNKRIIQLRDIDNLEILTPNIIHGIAFNAHLISSNNRKICILNLTHTHSGDKKYTGIFDIAIQNSLGKIKDQPMSVLITYQDRFIVGYPTGQIAIYMTKSSQLQLHSVTTEAHEQPVTSLLILNDKYIVAGFKDGVIKMSNPIDDWDKPSFHSWMELAKSPNTIRYLWCLPSGKLISIDIRGNINFYSFPRAEEQLEDIDVNNNSSQPSL